MNDSRRYSAPSLPDGSANANPAGVPFWTLVAEDFRANGGGWFTQGFWALFWHRFGNWRMGVRPKILRAPLTLLYRVMFKATEIFCGIKLSYNVEVGRRVRIEHFGGMILGARRIGDDVVIRQNTTFGVASSRDLNAKPCIGDGVDIGAGAAILGAVRVGDHAIIGANAVVLKDVPDYAVAVGVPARVVRIQKPPARESRIEPPGAPEAPAAAPGSAASEPSRRSGVQRNPEDRLRTSLIIED